MRAFVKRRTDRGVTKFMVDWEGYGPEDREWVRESQLREDLSPDVFERLVAEFGVQAKDGERGERKGRKGRKGR